MALLTEHVLHLVAMGQERTQGENLSRQRLVGTRLFFLGGPCHQVCIELVGFTADILTAAVIDQHSWVEHAEGGAACEEVKGDGIRIAAGGFQADTHLGREEGKGAQPAIQGSKAISRIGKDLVDGALTQAQHDIEFRFGHINAHVGRPRGKDSDQRRASFKGMVEYSRREETACGLPIILGCKLISGHEGFQIPFDLHRKPQTEGSHLRNELEAQGRGQIHLCLLSSGFLIVLYLIPLFTYLQYTRGEGGGERQGGPLWSPAVPFHLVPLSMWPHLKNLPV